MLHFIWNFKAKILDKMSNKLLKQKIFLTLSKIGTILIPQAAIFQKVLKTNTEITKIMDNLKEWILKSGFTADNVLASDIAALLYKGRL